MRINAGTIKSAIVTLLFATVLFAILPQLYPDVIANYHNLSAEMALLTTDLGTAPATFAGNIDEYVGWFWVIGIFLVGLSVALGLFRTGRN